MNRGDAPSSLEDLLSLAFEDVPASNRRRVYGVDYIHLPLEAIGDLYLTRFGWRRCSSLHPDQWYTGKRYKEIGCRLDGASGVVYRVPVQPPDGTVPDILVVKFSRVAQNVPLYIRSTFPEGVSQDVIDQAEFNDPFEEFGLLTALRSPAPNHSAPPVRTKRPLAIFSPQQKYDHWQISRNKSEFARHRARLKKNLDQSGESVDLDVNRDYITIFEWVKGENAQDLFMEGVLEQEDLRNLTGQVVDDLKQHGFVVLDNKPRHFILRRTSDGRDVLRHGDRIVYALVDFELLRPLP